MVLRDASASKNVDQFFTRNIPDDNDGEVAIWSSSGANEKYTYLNW